MSSDTPEHSGKPGNTGIKRIVKATGYSIKGLKAGWKNEAAIRQELSMLLIALPIIILVDVTLIEKILMFSSLMILVVVELLNSAIEAIVDRVSVEYHELSGRAKDLGSAAVMCMLILTAVVWVAILANRYLIH